MANPSEFEIPASILASAVVAKSDLTGDELATYALNLQRLYAVQMLGRRREEDSKRSTV